jgi:tripartite-type tricarboxylate transporter receptor subunit TctC
MLWNAIMAPAGTPQAIIDRLAAASAKAARAPDIIEKLQREGVDPVGGTLADLATLIARASAMARARQGRQHQIAMSAASEPAWARA